jgi:hypothetical protein
MQCIFIAGFEGRNCRLSDPVFPQWGAPLGRHF